MSDLRKAAEQALEALNSVSDWDCTYPIGKAKETLRQALAQSEHEPPSNKYNEKRIAWELERTALGDGYFGNALYVAMDMPQTTKADKEMLHRYMCGSNLKTDHIKLQDLAMRIYTAPPSIEAAVLAKQEACAKLVESFEGPHRYVDDIAAAIRARSEK